MRDCVLYINTYICVHIHICTGIRMYIIYKLVFHLLVKCITLVGKVYYTPTPSGPLCPLCRERFQYLHFKGGRREG